jgi:hypothetical protein
MRDIGHLLDLIRQATAAHSRGVIYDLHPTFLIPDDLNEMPVRLINEVEMDDTRDWVSRLLEIIPVTGTLDYRCFLGAPWRIDLTGARSS